MASTVTHSAKSASSFVNSIGVNTHVSYGWGSYNNVGLVVDDLKYLGVTNVRDYMANTAATTPLLNALAAAGYKLDIVVSSEIPAEGASGLATWISEVANLDTTYAGSVTAVEGLNEEDLFPFSYDGSSTAQAAADFQEALYDAVTSNSVLSSVAIYNFSVSTADAAAVASTVDDAAYTDYATAHSYYSASGNTTASLAYEDQLASEIAGGKSVVITETGFTTYQSEASVGTDQTSQAKLILNTLFDAYSQGVSKTYLYELLDDTNSSASNAEQNFGLFNSDGTPKLAATALHNVTTILSDGGSSSNATTTGSLNYGLSGLPSTGNSLLLEQSNGAFDLVIWNEPQIWNATTQTDVVNPTVPVTIQFGSTEAVVKVFDPLQGSTPIATYTNISQLTVSIVDHPLIIEIDSAATTTTTSVLPTSFTAQGFLDDLSALAAQGATTAITLTDTHVLPVASVATMDYYITKYASELARISGGYSFSLTTSASGWSKTTIYNSTGALVSNTTTSYTSTGAVFQVAVVEASGQTTTDTYNTSGVITEQYVKNTDGSSSTSYYTNGVLTQTNGVNADGTLECVLYNITGQSYTTDDKHFTAAGALISETRYHANGSLAYTYVVNSNGGTVTTTYSSTGVIASKVTTTSTSTVTDAYDSNGNLTQEAVKTSGSLVTTLYSNGLKTDVVTATSSSTTTDTYNSAGQLTQEYVKNSNGSASSTTYVNGVETQANIVNADGTMDTWLYNVTGQSYTTDHRHMSAAGALLSETRYHANGSLAYTYIVNSNGGTVTTTYSSTGVIASQVTTTSTSTVTDSYDSNGNLTLDVVKTSGSTVTTFYSNGLKTEVVTATSSSTTTDAYNSAGQLTQAYVKNSDGSASNTTYVNGVETQANIVNANGTLDTWLYNITGQSYTTDDKHMSAAGALLSESRYHADGTLAYSFVVNSDGSTTTTTYSASGVEATKVVASSTGTVTYTYDSTGRMLQEVIKNSTGASSTVTFTSSAIGAAAAAAAAASSVAATPVVTTSTTATGRTVTTTTASSITIDSYNATDELIQEYIKNSNGSASTTYFTDGLMTQTNMLNADHTLDTWLYNITGQSYVTDDRHLSAAGALLSDTHYYGSGTVAYRYAVNSDGSTTADTYSTSGVRILEVDATAVSSTTDTYNASGQLTQVYAKNANGTASTTYYTNGIMTQTNAINADGTLETLRYNIKGQSYVSSDIHATSTGTVLSQTLYHADGSADITAYASHLTLTGTTGNDTFHSAGGDTFAFQTNFGNDTITNFHESGALSDVLLLQSSSGASDFAQLHISQQGANTLISDGASNSITLTNTNALQLTASSFSFA